MLSCLYTGENFSLQHGRFDWDEETQGLILSSFFWGYVITHLPGGMLAEKFGGKYALGLGILSTAIFTLLTPLAAIHGGAGWLIAVRFIEGLGEVSSFLSPLLYVTYTRQFSIPLCNGRRGKLIINLRLHKYYHIEDMTIQVAKNIRNHVINSGTSSLNLM